MADESKSNREPTEWQTEDFVMEYDGVVITAKIRWWAKDISVTLVKPWRGLSTGTHMLYCVPVSFNDPDRRDKTIQALVIRLYETGKVIDENRDRLGPMISLYDEKSFGSELVGFVKEKTREAQIASRAEFRAGRIDGPTHQRTMAHLRKLLEAAQWYHHIQEQQLTANITSAIGEHDFMRWGGAIENVRKAMALKNSR